MPFNNGTYYADGAIALGQWARISGTWNKVGVVNVSASGTFTSGGLKTMPWDFVQFFTANGPVSEFKLIIEDSSGVYSAAITALTSVTWQIQSSSSSRSATPGGEKITATVRPQ